MVVVVVRHTQQMHNVGILMKTIRWSIESVEIQETYLQYNTKLSDSIYPNVPSHAPVRAHGIKYCKDKCRDLKMCQYILDSYCCYDNTIVVGSHHPQNKIASV